MVQSEKKKAYDKEYQKKSVVTKSIKLVKTTDKDIIEYIDHIDLPFSAFVKKLIREYINRENQK